MLIKKTFPLVPGVSIICIWLFAFFQIEPPQLKLWILFASLSCAGEIMENPKRHFRRIEEMGFALCALSMALWLKGIWGLFFVIIAEIFVSVVRFVRARTVPQKILRKYLLLLASHVLVFLYLQQKGLYYEPLHFFAIGYLIVRMMNWPLQGLVSLGRYRDSDMTQNFIYWTTASILHLQLIQWTELDRWIFAGLAIVSGLCCDRKGLALFLGFLGVSINPSLGLLAPLLMFVTIRRTQVYLLTPLVLSCFYLNFSPALFNEGFLNIALTYMLAILCLRNMFISGAVTAYGWVQLVTALSVLLYLIVNNDLHLPMGIQFWVLSPAVMIIGLGYLGIMFFSRINKLTYYVLGWPVWLVAARLTANFDQALGSAQADLKTRRSDNGQSWVDIGFSAGDRAATFVTERLGMNVVGLWLLFLVLVFIFFRGGL